MVSRRFSVVDGYAVVADHGVSKVYGGNEHPAASSALTVINIAGSIIGVMLLYAPTYTFVNPVLKEGSLGDRMVYAHLLACFNSVMWTLYAWTDLPNRLLLFIIGGMGIIAHLCYIIFFIKFAKGKKRMCALVLLIPVSVISMIMIVLVPSMVLTHRWSCTFVDVIASTSGASTLIVPVYDLVIVMKSKQINSMNSIIIGLISLFGACSWTAYSFMSVPINKYVMVPNFMGILSAASHIIVYSYLIYLKTGIHSVLTDDAVDYSYEMRKLFASSLV